MNPAKIFVVALSIAAGYLFAQIPQAETNGDTARVTVKPKPTPPVYAADADANRELSGEEILVTYFKHKGAIESRPPGPSESMRTQVETWLALNPKHDPRSPNYVPTPLPELPPPGDIAVATNAKAKEEPKYTQPQPVAVKAAPTQQVMYAHRVPVTVRYGFRGRLSRTEYRVQYSTSPQPVQYGFRSCSNGSCR